MENEEKPSIPQTFKQCRLFGRPIKIKPKKIKMHKESEYPIGRISQSMVKDYLKCPKLFYYRHILKIKLPMKSLPLVFGGAVHKAVESYYNGGEPYEVFNREFKADRIEPFDELEYEAHIKEGKRLIDEFINAQDWLTNYHGISLNGESEHKFNIWWRDPATYTLLPVQVSGIFDRTTDKHQILEFKTSSKPYKQDDVDIAIQKQMYSFSYYLLHKVIPTEFIYIVLIKGRKKDPIQVLKSTVTKSEFSQIFQTVDLVLKGIKGGQFNKGTGFLHRYCDCQRYEEALLIK